MDEQQTTLDGFEQSATPAKKRGRKPKSPSTPRPSAVPPPAPPKLGGEAQIISYRHLDRRKNNPEVGVVTPATDPDLPKTVWNYDPHLDPALQFDNSRSSIETLIDDALASGDEADMRAALEELKRLQSPYLNWTGKAERTSFEVDTVSLHVHERMDSMNILAAVRKKVNSLPLGGGGVRRGGSRLMQPGQLKIFYQVEVNGFDYFDTTKCELVSGGKGKIAMWLLDTDYDERSLFPRQVFFPMAGKGEGGRSSRRISAPNWTKICWSSSSARSRSSSNRAITARWQLRS